MEVLSKEQIQEYEANGYLVFDPVFTGEEVDRLLSRLEEIVSGRVDHGGRIKMQIEPSVQRGEAVASSPQHALRKVWELVANDQVFLDFARHPKILAVVCSLLGPDVKMFRDALMMKPPHHGSAKPYHQDSAYWAIEPPSLVSVWTALDEATRENGCMRVIPGSHHWGMMEHKHLQDFQVDEAELDLSAEVAVPLRRGGCIAFHSLLLHATSPNLSPHPRRAMIVSYMSAKSRYTGAAEQKPRFLQISGREYPGAV